VGDELHFFLEKRNKICYTKHIKAGTARRAR